MADNCNDDSQMEYNEKVVSKSSSSRTVSDSQSYSGIESVLSGVNYDYNRQIRGGSTKGGKNGEK